MRNVFIFLLITGLLVAGCETKSGNGENNTETTAQEESTDNGMRSNQGTPPAGNIQNDPAAAQRRSENTFNATPDPTTGESGFGLQSFQGACEQAVLTAAWIEKMEASMENCELRLEIKQYGETTSWTVPLGQVDKDKMVPFLDDEYNPGFRLPARGNQTIIRKKTGGSSSEVSQLELVFADKPNASKAIYSMIKMIDECQGKQD